MPGPSTRLLATLLVPLWAAAAGGCAPGLAPGLAIGDPVGVSGAAATCPDSLQSLVDAAAPGATVRLSDCVYRETVEIDKPLTLVGSGATEVRGSDVWGVWTRSGTAWTSDDRVPPLSTAGVCRSGTDRCRHAEQVFVDGVAQAFVGSNPGAGQFAIAADRRVILGSDPAGHAVEVTTRARWLQISASDVTVDGLTFRDAGNGPQAEDAALRISGGSERFALARSHLLVAHGALLGLVGGVGHRVLDSELGWAGQEGFGIAGVADTLIARTYIHDNNTDDFEPGWEAGAGKASRSTGLTFDGNTVSNNRGPGLWCDIACESVTYVGNRVDHNENAGIFYEISTAGDIRSNVVFENGWGRVDWGWGAGILVSSSGSTDVADNTVAWNADGITVVSQPRPDRPAAAGTGISVHDNAVIGAPQPGDNGDAFLVAWLQDGDGPLYRPDSHNDGGDNEFWSSAAEPAGERFHWALGASTLEAFASTPGGRGGRYLSLGERNAVLSAAGAPLGPEQRLVHVAPTRRELVTFGLGGLGLVGIAVLGGIVLWRRRRAAGGRARSASPS